MGWVPVWGDSGENRKLAETLEMNGILLDSDKSLIKYDQTSISF